MGLGVVAIEGLGNAHGALDHALVPGLLGSFQVIHQGDIVATALSGDLAGKEKVENIRLEVGILNARLAGRLGLGGGLGFGGGVFPGAIQAGAAARERPSRQVTSKGADLCMQLPVILSTTHQRLTPTRHWFELDRLAAVAGSL